MGAERGMEGKSSVYDVESEDEGKGKKELKGNQKERTAILSAWGLRHLCPKEERGRKIKRKGSREKE